VPDDFETALAAKFEAVAEATEEEVQETPEAPEEPEEITAEADVEPEDGEEPEPERPRDEHGRFVKQDRPDWLPPQFKSEQDFARSYAELQSLLGRQGQELGELRRIAEQIADSTPRNAQPAFANVSESLDENPEAVAYWALQQGHIPGESALMDQILDAWYVENPRAASRFEREVEIARLKHEFTQEVQPSVEAVRQESLKRAALLAQRDIKSKYPDFDQVMESITEEEVAGLDPNVLRQLQQTDPKAAIELVYRWVKVSKQGKQDASKEAVRSESLERKRKAAVASSSATPASREKSPIEQFKDMLLEPDAHSVHHGLVRE
jgi:hypothetical protein